MSVQSFTGWDIGGAHLKVASVDGSGGVNFVKQYASPLWQGLDCLETLFPKVITELPETNHRHALTITAELADVFINREQGAKQLIALFEKKLGEKIRLYSLDDGLIDIVSASNRPKSIASANWHASASYVASLVGSGVFIDMGSTTTDIIPFHNKKLINKAEDDKTRLQCDELVYTGVIRTALMSLTNKVPFQGEWQNIATENFATSADVYRLLSYLHKGDDLMLAADGKSKDMQGSMRRMARMVGTDHDDSIDALHWYKLAEYFQEKQIQLISDALMRVLSGMPYSGVKLVLAGVGQFLLKETARRVNLSPISFGDLCTTDVSYEHDCNVSASAVAIAQLNRITSLNL